MLLYNNYFSNITVLIEYHFLEVWLYLNNLVSFSIFYNYVI